MVRGIGKTQRRTRIDMLEATTIAVSVAREWRDLYEAFWRPEAFVSWASGLADASLTQAGEEWRTRGPGGPVVIVFTGRNALGVMDHWVRPQDGPTIYVPLRIIGNDDGALVSLTLFRQPGMSDAKFAEDADWVRRDLQRLKAIAEA